MPIAIVSKVVALLAHVSPDDIAALPPAERRRLADQCRHIAKLAEEGKPQPERGILSELGNGQRHD